jgi:hypothetical protein
MSKNAVYTSYPQRYIRELPEPVSKTTLTDRHNENLGVTVARLRDAIKVGLADRRFVLVKPEKGSRGGGKVIAVGGSIGSMEAPIDDSTK